MIKNCIGSLAYINLAKELIDRLGITIEIKEVIITKKD